MKKIKIDSLSQDKTKFGIKITFISGKEKYIFYNTKKDGTTTKAFDQFRRFGFNIGDTVEAEVKEEQKKFLDDNKKEVKYTERKIIYFKEVENTPVFEKAKEVANIDDEIVLPF